MLNFLPKGMIAQLAVGSVAVAGAASIAYVVVAPREDLPSVSDPVPEVATVPETEPETASRPAPDSETPLQAEPDATDPPQVAAVEPSAAGLPAEDNAPELRPDALVPLSDMAPSFDIVRVTDLGNALIAGKAPASSTVSTLIDEVAVAQTVSTPTGEFVMMFDLDVSAVPRVLELEARLSNGDRVRSQETLMLAPRSTALAASMEESPVPGLPQQEAALEVAEAAPPVADTQAPDAPRLASVPEAADTPGVGSSDSSAPLAMLMRADGSMMMLDDGAQQRDQGDGVSIDTVVYDAEGDVALSGRAARGAADIQIYLDNQPIIRARAQADGNWQAQLAGIERGVYRLRVDELDEAAQVVSRAEIPFERVTPQIAREASGPQAVIVQPGNTLWAMSVERYGEGMRFMRIFDANRDQIRNPDLIYPGQVFVLPEE